MWEWILGKIFAALFIIIVGYLVYRKARGY